MNYIRLFQQAENNLIFNRSLDLIKRFKQNNDIKFVRVKIKSWEELCSLYSRTYDGYIYIPKDDAIFGEDMKKFCGEEFEIAMELHVRDLFRIINGNTERLITQGMVDIIESKEFEINKNWPLIKIKIKNVLVSMFDYLYNNCDKSDRKILDHLKQMDYESNKRKVRIKSWDELTNEYTTVSRGIMIEPEHNVFYNEMRPLCEQEFIANYRDDLYTIGHLATDGYYWTITRGMVKEV